MLQAGGSLPKALTWAMLPQFSAAEQFVIYWYLEGVSIHMPSGAVSIASADEDI